MIRERVRQIAMIFTRRHHDGEHGSHCMDMAWHCTKHCSDRARRQLGRGGHNLLHRRKDLILHIACVERHFALYILQSPAGLGKSENPTQELQASRFSDVSVICARILPESLRYYLFCPCVVDTMYSRLLKSRQACPILRNKNAISW